jgi:hypothetical protein
VVGDTLFKILGESDISPARKGKACDAIYVTHAFKPSYATSFAKATEVEKATEGAILRSSPLQNQVRPFLFLACHPKLRRSEGWRRRRD